MELTMCSFIKNLSSTSTSDWWYSSSQTVFHRLQFTEFSEATNADRHCRHEKTQA